MKDSYLNVYNKYCGLLESLRKISNETNNRVIDGQDNLFSGDNINFFSKSYILILCTYLEAYLMDVAVKLFETHCANVNECNVPAKFIYAKFKFWENDKESDVNGRLIINSSKNELKKFFDKNKLSGNLNKTFSVFSLLGVELKSVKKSSAIKDLISSIVDKRNNIIHRNDNATDVTFKDIDSYIDTIKEYMKMIYEDVINSNYCPKLTKGN